MYSICRCHSRTTQHYLGQLHCLKRLELDTPYDDLNDYIEFDENSKEFRITSAREKLFYFATGDVVTESHEMACACSCQCMFASLHVGCM